MEKIIEMVRVDAGHNHNAVFRCYISGGKIRTESGRISGRETTIVPGPTYPEEALDRLLEMRRKQGYVERDRQAAPVKSARTEIPDREVRELVGSLLEMSRFTVVKGFAMKPEMIVEEDIKRGEAIMGRLSEATDAASANRLLMELFIALPRRMDDVGALMAKTDADVPSVYVRERALLDNLALVKRTDAACGRTVLEELGLELRRCDAAEEAVIARHLDDETRKHFARAFLVQHQERDAMYAAYKAAHGVEHDWFLYHGTRNENVASLLARGFLSRRHQNAATTGSMLGDPRVTMYFAPEARKSARYSSLGALSYWTGQHERVGYIFLANAAIKNPMHLWHRDVPGRAFFTAEKIAPYDAVYAHPGWLGFLKNPEIALYEADLGQARISHMFELR